MMCTAGNAESPGSDGASPYLPRNADTPHADPFP
jgi:hypothetical protein